MPDARKLESAPVSLGDRLKDDVQLYCPLFQRRYVWGKSQIDMLWADIDTVIDEQYEGRFLGALVFDDERPSTAGEAGLYWIIDGQQRMTTMVLTIVALAAHARRFGEEGQQIAKDLYEQYVVSRKSKTRNQPKLRPTLKDTRQFNDVLRSAFDKFDLDIDVERETGESNGDLSKAYKLLQSHIERRTSATEEGTDLSNEDVVARIEQLRDVLLDRLEFVEIRLGDEHDPNEVFDRLNNEGVKLGIIDLVRNEILKRLRDDAKLALKLYSEQWKPFEDAFENESARTGYFFPFALTIDSSITTAGTFKALSVRWATVASTGGDDKKAEMLAIMQDLRRHQSSYNAISSGRLDLLDIDIKEPVRRLNALNRPSSCYPYVMQLLTATSAGEVDTADAVECLSILESFLVRRAILGIEPTGLHAIFKRLWADAHGNPANVRREIVSTTVVFPDDERLRVGIEDGNLYDRRVCAYVLEEYERSHTAGDVLETFPPMTIDHVMPQSYSGEWTAAFTQAEHDSLVDSWANLVPLSIAANAGKGTSSWTDSRARLANETVFATTKYLYDSYDDWSPETIRRRSRVLQDWAVGRWPFYGQLVDVQLAKK